MPVIRVMISDINVPFINIDNIVSGTWGNWKWRHSGAPANSGPATGGLDLRELLDLEGLFSADGMSRPESTKLWDLDLPDLIASLPKANNY
ncbi:hypothetical protein BM221_000381 [Beauveria bassiana]|uniref:Uncharacterized protein n=1 Tax=Beauveria bassiana TaxID=176275 RepID=A0A2N6P0C8_BEABA|nr:hypothetical protein BM221_000381 [Beauveria bassiana]